MDKTTELAIHLAKELTIHNGPELNPDDPGSAKGFVEFFFNSLDMFLTELSSYPHLGAMEPGRMIDIEEPAMYFAREMSARVIGLSADDTESPQDFVKRFSKHFSTSLNALVAELTSQNKDRTVYIASFGFA